MGGFLLVVSVIGFLVCIILLLIKLFKKNPLKKTAISLLGFVIMFFIGAALLPSTPEDSAVSDVSQEQPEKTNIQNETDVAEAEATLAAEAVNDDSEETSEVFPTEPVRLPNYRIIEIEDLTFSNVTRYNYQVVIDEPVEPEMIQRLAEVIVEEAKTNVAFNALSIMFYDYKEYIGFGYTLGKAEFAPGGDWGKANSVKPGDYHLMRYNYDLRTKDWSTQLTNQEVSAWRSWEDTFDQLFDEEAAFTHIQKEFGLSREKAEATVNKQISWTFQNIQ